MIRFHALMLIGAAGGLAIPAPAQVPAAPIVQSTEIPVELFTEPPAVLHPTLSPDGTRVLARMRSGDQEVLGIAELAGSGLITVPFEEGTDLVSYRWAGNERVLVSVGMEVKWYGNDRYATRLFVYDLSEDKAMSLDRRTQGLDGDNILWVDPQGESLLLSMQADVNEYPSIFRVNLDNGKFKMEMGPREHV